MQRCVTVSPSLAETSGGFTELFHPATSCLPGLTDLVTIIGVEANVIEGDLHIHSECFGAAMPGVEWHAVRNATVLHGAPRPGGSPASAVGHGCAIRQRRHRRRGLGRAGAVEQVAGFLRAEALSEHRGGVAQQVALRRVGQQQARDLVHRQVEHFHPSLAVGALARV